MNTKTSEVDANPDASPGSCGACGACGVCGEELSGRSSPDESPGEAMPLMWTNASQAVVIACAAPADGAEPPSSTD
jgi:hypothetical protein